MASMFYSNAVVWVAVIPAIALENVVCLLAISTRKRWKSPDVLLFSLIMAHFLTLVLPLLLYSAVIVGQGVWRESACKFLVWSVMSFKVVNSLQICFLSMDRVWTLKWPGSYRLHNTAGQSMRTVSFIWIFGLFIGCIPLLGWPRDDPLATAVCSLILDVGGYGYSLCIVVIILGSFAVSSVCIATILLHLAFSRVTLDGVPAPSAADFKRPIPEIVIESETGERTAAVQVCRERQNRQICILVSVMVTVEFFINGIPFVVINLMALVSNSQTEWMPISIMWCTLSVTLINPVLLGLVCQRYRRSYAKLGMCVAEACGCADGGIRDTTTTAATVGGIQRQETFDSLDNFSETEDPYGRGGLGGLGVLGGLAGEPSFSIDLEDEQGLDYGITASMERDIRSLEQAGILSSDAADADNNEAYIRATEVRDALSSGERRALWLAQKAVRQAAAGNKDGRLSDGTSAGNSADEPGTSADDSPGASQSSPGLGQHRKLERNSGRGGSGKRPNGGEPGQTIHTIRAEIENGGLTVPRANDLSEAWTPEPMALRPLEPGKTGRLGNGRIVSTQSLEVTPTRKETKESKKSRKKRRSSVPPAKEETAGRSPKLSPAKATSAAAATEPSSHGLRSASSKLSALRERMMSDNSTNHGSGELYDIPEEEPDEVQETSFFRGLMPPGAASHHRRHSDEPATFRDKPFEPVVASPVHQPARPAKAGKKAGKKKGRDRRHSRWGSERSVTIDYEDNPLTREEELLKRAIERDESSSHFAYDNLSSDADLTDGCMSEHSGYVSSRNSSLVSRLGTSISIDASVEYDMDMIVIEQVDSAVPPSPPSPASPPPTSKAAVKLGRSIGEASEATTRKPTPDAIATSTNSPAPTSEATTGEPAISTDRTGPTAGTGPENPSTDLPVGSPPQVDPRTPTNVPRSEKDPWSEQRGRPRASSAGAEQATTAKDRREKYKRARSEKIVLEPINAESSREILYF